MKLFIAKHIVPALLALIVFMNVLPFLESIFSIVDRLEEEVDQGLVEHNHKHNHLNNNCTMSEFSGGSND